MAIDDEKTRPDGGIVAFLHAKAQFSWHSIQPTDANWEQLDTLALERFPLLTDTLQDRKKLSLQELRTCILVRLGFRNGEIAVLLRTSIQRITNIKAGANLKLFGTRSAMQLAKNLSELDGHARWPFISFFSKMCIFCVLDNLVLLFLTFIFARL